MIPLGIFLGLLAAFTQSISYLYSRAYSVKRHTQSTIPLLLISHTLMGGASLLVLPFVWTPILENPAAYLAPLAGACLPYLLAQGLFFFALKSADASRVAPLLSIKIIFVALLWMVIGKSDTPLTGQQWFAVALSATAAFAFSYTGKRLPARAIGAMLITVSMYSVSDVYIIKLVEALNPSPDLPPTLNTSCLAATLCYLFCGLITAALLPFLGSKSRADWSAALPFSITWYASMFLFFTCLAWTGPVLGNITLATRGLISIMLGIVIARAGHHHLEQHTPAPIIVRRAIAAILMIGAIVLYTMKF